ncbi:hypothetical protein EV424DRAFT_1551492 [Suillus variegatus]|nr:hypothetical protein EV424DRAFT_1551492 [Suillus variegatus]
MDGRTWARRPRTRRTNAQCKAREARKLEHIGNYEGKDRIYGIETRESLHHLNGRISLVICCPGSQATPTLSPEHLSLDLYITPHELCKSPDRIGGDISVFVQAFGEEFAIPHLQHFTECCCIEGVVPPHHSSQVNSSAVPHLPAPMAATGSCIYCSARPPQQFQHDLQANAQFNTVSSSAVREGTAMALLDSNMPPNKI